jgi:hypothetical protein
LTDCLRSAGVDERLATGLRVASRLAYGAASVGAFDVSEGFQLDAKIVSACWIGGEVCRGVGCRGLGEAALSSASF